MRRLMLVVVFVGLLVANAGTSAMGEELPSAQAIGQVDGPSVARLREQLSQVELVGDPKVDRRRSIGLPGTSALATGAYPVRAGTYLVTTDLAYGIFKSGHAAMVLGSSSVVEAMPNGVQWGANTWAATKQEVYGMTVRGTSVQQDASAALWVRGKVGKPYNPNFTDIGTRSRFYCSQLVWAAFKDLYGINLDTPEFGQAIHPYELAATSQAYQIYHLRKW